MFELIHSFFQKIIITLTLTTIAVTSFFTPSKTIPSIQPTPTTAQQILIQEEITPTQTPLKGSSQVTITTKKGVSPIPTITISQIQSDTSSTTTQSPDFTTERPTACFTISGNYFDSDGYAYGLPITLDASCSKNALVYFWYMNEGKIIKLETPVNEKIVTLFQGGSYAPLTSDVTYQIKLTVASAKGKLTDTIVKSIKVKKVDPIEFCFTPNSGTRKNINFNEEVSFSATCTKDNNTNPINKYFWKFRDGDLNNSVVKEGKEVSHKFTKFAKNFMGGRSGFEAELCAETKWGIAGCSIQHYYPSENDPVLQNLRECSNQAGKDSDKCIAEMGL